MEKMLDDDKRINNYPTENLQFLHILNQDNDKEIKEKNNVNKEKKRTRKSKKTIEKELLNDYYNDKNQKTEGKIKKNASGKYSTDDDNDLSKKKLQCRNIFDNYEYLSFNERMDFEKKFTKPINANQEEYVTTLKNKNKKIIIASGPAGTGKTLFATEFGVKYFLLGNYEKLIFTRPSVCVDEDLGYLPGTIEEKMSPFVRPIYDILYSFISPKEVQILMEEKIIEIIPLGYMRGRTFKNSWIVADEMQNSTVNQMKMLLTRLGDNSRLVITGDLEQFDKSNEINGLEDFLNKFKGRRSSSISSFEFNRDDVQREEVVKEILHIYSNNIISDIYINNDNDNIKDDNPECSIYI
jgi:phosphate starvation-inducible PhoH-like protein